MCHSSIYSHKYSPLASRLEWEVLPTLEPPGQVSFLTRRPSWARSHSFVAWPEE